MDWERAIDRNCEALCDIVGLLLRLAGIGTLRPVVATLPRHLRFRILAILRPAEFAARRLIAIAACRLDLNVALPTGTRQRRAIGEELEGGTDNAAGTPARTRSDFPAFQLFDPFKPFVAPWLTPEEIARLDDPDEGRWIPAPSLPSDEPVDARGLCSRIAALRYALENLDDQATRLARWRARRRAQSASCPGPTRTRPRRWSPMRPVEEVLKECHALAHDAWYHPDTS